MANNKVKYNNEYNKGHYDRINLMIAKGYKERIKEKADSLVVGLSEYIFTLICNDLDGATTDIKEQKQGFSDEDMALLKKWQVTSRYYDMIENVSLNKGDYYIQLKAGYINDITESREIHTKTAHDMRITITKSHKLGESAHQPSIKQNPAAYWLSSETIHQLDKWQVPKKYYHMISSLTVLNGLYTINLIDGYINDSTGTNKVEFRSVAELRAIMKLTHKE